MSFITGIRRFLVNEAGNYSLMFALASPAIIGAVAIAVETTSLIKDRLQLQTALDTAALATGKHLAKTTDEAVLEDYARSYFYANLKEQIDHSKVTVDFQLDDSGVAGKTIQLTANYDYPRAMGSYLGINDIVLNITSEVAAGNRTIEVAIVLDNSGSMSNYTGSTGATRIEKAKQAAGDLATQLYALANISNKPDPVMISVVPFGSSVNIGPDKRGESWMDMNGWSSIHHENIEWDAADERGDSWPLLQQMSVGFKGYPNGSNSEPPSDATNATNVWLSRWTLFDAIGQDWAGCVAMRPWPHHTTDITPSDIDPDTLIVPMFAPDEPRERGSGEDDDYRNNYLNEYRRKYEHDLTYVNSKGRIFLKTNIPGVGSNKGSYSRQYDRQSWAMQYNTKARYSRLGDHVSRDYGKYGPNMMCTTDALTPLSADEFVIQAAIDAMSPAGFTNIQAGISWGWRTLSSNEPFTGGRAYSEVENDKFIIVLTDGNNTYPGQSTLNQSQYTAWGYKAVGRIFDGQQSTTLVTAMNNHTMATCSNIKAIIDGDNEAAYKIFTIAYDVADGSSVKALLENCASTKEDGSKYYYDVSGDALAAAMQDIGNEISRLRLSK